MSNEPDSLVLETLPLGVAVETAVHAELRGYLADIALVQVTQLSGEESLDGARELAVGVDLLLLDSDNPGLAVKQLGGRGRTHGWDLSVRIVAGSPVPVFLAGGLCARNVAAAIRTARPNGASPTARTSARARVRTAGSTS